MECEDDRFEWDSDKDDSNYDKHGIGFDDAKDIFFQPTFYGPAFTVDGEQRAQAIGKLNGVYLVVIFTDRDKKKRIISARPATEAEKERFKTNAKRWRTLFDET
ncbi:MAG: BrnT family toxin [Candidatus Melainabacteria bacterium]|nr:BrnT family toxin [Candidatus Melainabacteria bacterium]